MSVMDQAHEPKSPWKCFFHGIFTGLSVGVLYALLNHWFAPPEPERDVAAMNKEKHMVHK